MLALTSLPVDILILVLESLGVHDLTALSLTCRAIYTLVTEYGWPSYLRAHPRPSWSLANARSSWLPRTRARYDVMADAAWARNDFIARPLSRTWQGKLQPVLAISTTRLVVGAGSNLYSYSFGSSPTSSSSPPVSVEGSVSLLDHPERSRNITALTFVYDAGLDATLDVAFHDGAIERVVLTSTLGSPSSTGGGSEPSTPTIILCATRTRVSPPMPMNDFVECLSHDLETNSTLALSSTGHARLTTSSGSTSNISLNCRSWTSHLSLSSSSPYAAFGTASTTPLTVHSITEGGGLTEHPTAILHTSKAGGGGGDDQAPIDMDKLPSSAVYGITSGPINSPWGASPQILVSGWFDGQVRCYDLRASCSRISAPPTSSKSTPSPPSPSSSSSSLSSPSPNTSPRSTPSRSPSPSPSPRNTSFLRPVLSLADRWSYEPIYSVSSGGGSGAHIAAGTARHSVVSFWDVRSPSTGWSVHAPGNDPSPVYSVVLESSRFWGVTQSRPFVYDFGPGVSLDTYPPIPHVRGIDNLKQKKSSKNRATYHVLGYAHNSSGLCHL